MAVDKYYYGVGRRKESIATARLYSGGDGEVSVNDQPLEVHFNHPEQQERVVQPLTLLDKRSSYRISLHIKGGGLSGQADAAKLAIANALVESSEDLRPTLKRAGYLKRDARVKERKKYGLKRARKAPQFTKR
ncbi:MAG: 30S ribosomal protein S9 [Candidatus Saccharimonadales bacterium]